MKYKVDLLKALAHHVPAGFYWKDKHGTYLGCNDAFLSSLQLTFTELIGKTDEQLWPESAKSLKSHDQIVIKNDQSLTIEETFALENRQLKTLLVVKMPWKDENNNILGIIANSIDITQNKTVVLDISSKTYLADKHQEQQDFPKQKTYLQSTNNRKNRILLVEDQTFAADITKIILSELNCQVDLAIDSKTAILQAKNNNYDLIFMDIGLSDLDGYETTKRIRLNELSKDKHVPIIALTAYIDHHDREHCLSVGMNAILIKPLLKEKALDTLNTFIPNTEEVKIPVAANDEMDWSLLSGKVIDLAKGAELFNGNITLAKKMIDTFIASLPLDLETLEFSYKNEDWTAIEKIAHQLRGNVSYCGMPRLQEACARLENHLKAGYQELAALLYKQLLKEIKNVKKEHLRSIE